MDTPFTRIAERESRLALIDFLVKDRRYFPLPKPSDIPAVGGKLIGEAWTPERTFRLADAVLSRISSEGVPGMFRGGRVCFDAAMLIEPTGEAEELLSWDDITIFTWRPELDPRPVIPNHASVYSMVLNLRMSATDPDAGHQTECLLYAWRSATLRFDFHEDDWVYVKFRYGLKLGPHKLSIINRIWRHITKKGKFSETTVQRYVNPKGKCMELFYKCDGDWGVHRLIDHLQRQSKEILP
jgi:hypothetical protein